jgi:hypothetical protein
MAIIVSKAAKGNKANTGTPKTPAPTKNPMPDLISRIRAPQGDGYGQNSGPSNPSSINPGAGGPLSPLAKVLMEAGDDGENVLGKIIAGGTAKTSGSDQTRDVSDKGYPAAHGMKASTVPVKIPDKLGLGPAADPVEPNK